MKETDDTKKLLEIMSTCMLKRDQELCSLMFMEPPHIKRKMGEAYILTDVKHLSPDSIQKAQVIFTAYLDRCTELLDSMILSDDTIEDLASRSYNYYAKNSIPQDFILKPISLEYATEITRQNSELLKEVETMSAAATIIDDSTIKTSKEERLSTGLDLTGKMKFTDKGELFDVFIKAYGIIMDYGANKYAYSNFEHAPLCYEDVLDCLMRHTISYRKGELVDPESKQLHLGHIVARSAIASMKAERLATNDHEDAARFIGWKDTEIEKILSVLPEQTLSDKLFSSLRPKEIPYSAHVTSEMMSVVSESIFWDIRDNYCLESWCKTFELLLISFISSNFNGESDRDKANHAKILLWVSINIYYHESKLKNETHIGYYKG